MGKRSHILSCLGETQCLSQCCPGSALTSALRVLRSHLGLVSNLATYREYRKLKTLNEETNNGARRGKKPMHGIVSKACFCSLVVYGSF